MATLLLCYWVVVSRSPFIFERYFLTMGPLITVMVLSDGRVRLELSPKVSQVEFRNMTGPDGVTQQVPDE